MKNSIEAHILFSFKGENYDLAMVIDLDAIMENSNELPNIHQLLAKNNNIDTYSYLYEVMENHEISYRNPLGSATHCLNNNIFELEKFRAIWQEEKDLDTIQAIAQKHLDIDDINQHPDMKMALLEALRKNT